MPFVPFADWSDLDAWYSVAAVLSSSTFIYTNIFYSLFRLTVLPSSFLLKSMRRQCVIQYHLCLDQSSHSERAVHMSSPWQGISTMFHCSLQNSAATWERYNCPSKQEEHEKPLNISMQQKRLTLCVSVSNVQSPPSSFTRFSDELLLHSEILRLDIKDT